MNKRYPFFLCCCLWLLGPVAWAQATGPQPDPPVVSGDFRGLPFEQFAQRIEAQTPYRFFFNPATTDTVVVRLQADRLPLVAALTQVLGRARLHFALDEATQRVFVTAGPPLQTQLLAGDAPVLPVEEPDDAPARRGPRARRGGVPVAARPRVLVRQRAEPGRRPDAV
ncbi:hypothetical protein [Hymenobacter sp. PAMC 26628]|uniref:hypothetical protein n=1 Tax=Hymenobacter sp. PAMC 26628 TaxID=1484118 RepID=UPI0007706642|nr:hypothetical protein [Hymenobacter sp. PAMC 26628]AMJ65671.1 hypothetical protein AXW84_09710 [Hymenobacter sp. PAMC 26628]